MYSFKLYLRDWWINLPLAISLALQGLMWWYGLTRLAPRRAEQVFLHYNIIFGVDWAGQWWQILYLPAAGAAVILINYGFSWLVYRTDKFYARLLSLAAALFQIGAAAALVFIVGLNI